MSGETEREESGWTTDTLRYFFQKQLDDLTVKLDERYATQTKALDAAFSAADKAVTAALLAAKEAVNKAETATEKRFESVNEFRAQLADQATRFMPRIEAEQRIDQNSEKITALDNRHREDISLINSRLDLAAGRGTGLTNAWGYLTAIIVAVAAVVGVVIAVTQ